MKSRVGRPKACLSIGHLKKCFVSTASQVTAAAKALAVERLEGKAGLSGRQLSARNHSEPWREAPANAAISLSGLCMARGNHGDTGAPPSPVGPQHSKGKGWISLGFQCWTGRSCGNCTYSVQTLAPPPLPLQGTQVSKPLTSKPVRWKVVNVCAPC